MITELIASLSAKHNILTKLRWPLSREILERVNYMIHNILINH